MSGTFRLALCQMPTGMDKSDNVKTALEILAEARAGGADMAVLPEMFMCPYSNRYFRAFSEPGDGPTLQAVAAAAKDLGLYIAAGTIPEADGEKLYNTCFVFGPDGRMLAKHRKVHLFDINIEGGQKFRESLTLSAGEDLCLFDTPWGRVGVTVCFDIRFPELALALAERGARLIISPASFAVTTGSDHWETLFRARALDTLCFTAGCGAARDEKGIYVAYANSIVCSPWGQVIARAGTGREVLFADIDMDYADRIRAQLPVLSARKPSLYTRFESEAPAGGAGTEVCG